MRRILPSALIFLSAIHVQGQDLVTALIQHGNDSQLTTSIVADPDNNMVAAVNFWDDLDADPGPSVVNFNSAGSMDVAMIKLDPAGNYIWGKQLSGTGFNQSSDIDCDTDGNIFIFGYFNGTMDMQPGPGVSNIVSLGSDDIFVGKYDPDGNLLWAYTIGGTGTEQNYGFAVDNDGNAVLYGYFQNTVDFNPGAGTFNLTAGIGGSDFILKLNNNGTFNYAISMASAYGNEMKIDADNNIYCTGLFWGTVDFDPGPGTANLTAAGFTNDSYIQKLSPSGAFMWAGKFSSSLADQATSIGIDETNNAVYVCGHFEGTLDADPGPGTANLISGGYVDAYVVRLNATTGTYVWGKSFSGLGWQAALTMDVSQAGLVQVGGSFDQTADFDPGAGTFNLTSAGSTDIFKVALLSDGTFSAADRTGASGQDQPICITFDITGALLMTGSFDGNVDFDPGPDNFFLNTAFTGWDGYIAKYCTTYTIDNFVSICAGESYFAAGAWQTTAGDYYDYFIPEVGCDSIVITHLTINTPVVDLGEDISICSGETVVLNAGNPGASFLWNTGANTQTITTGTAGTFGVTITDPAGCTAADTIIVNVNSSPVVNLGPNQTVCSGETVILNAGNPGATYAWSTGAVTQTISINESGNYSVTVTNAFGCTDNDLMHLTVNPVPVITLPVSQSFCAGSAVTLDAENPGATYLWNTGATMQTITTNISGIYTVTVTDAEGCSTSDTTALIELSLPEVELGADLEICNGETVTLDASIPGGSYLWNTGATTPIISADASGTYSVTVTDDNGCVNADTMDLIVHPLPIIDLGEDAAYCADDEVILDATYPDATYAWSTGATTPSILVTADGTYSVIVTSAAGCVSTDEISITIHPLPIADLGDDILTCANEPVMLDATTPACTYLWNTGETTATIMAETAGTYSVSITNSFGCQITDSITITHNAVPDVQLLLPATEICADAEAVILSGGTPDGGTYFGTGVADGMFDPAATGTGSFTVNYSFTDVNGCSDTAAQTIEVTVCQLLEEEISDQLRIYPNPAMQNLHVEITNYTEWEYMTIVDQNGRICHRQYIDGTNTTINVSQLPSGHYYLTLINTDRINRSPLIILH